MRTPRTTASLTKARLTKAGISATLAAAMLGSGFLLTASPATAAESPYKAAVAECLATYRSGAALRDCLHGIAPQRTPRADNRPAVASPGTKTAKVAKAAPEAASEAAPEAAPEAASAPAGDSGGSADVWGQLRECEASGDYGLNDGSGYYGAYQFDLSTWQGLGYDGYPNEASAAVQDEAARQLQSQRGWQPWPACSRKLGLR
ncbi:MAG: resuscitation-promoting factor RpfA [Actinomycetota bacterium]|jgi:hypothetical protein|nr:resuscitation-promoting factor RpfA [Actinomycetota bacterium]